MKKYGQNFLTNPHIIKKIISSSKISKKTNVLEIGPGDGSLTREIIKIQPKNFIAVEIDQLLNEKLKIFFLKNKYKLVFQDALIFKENNYFSENFTIISNLPYNISLALLVKWIYQINNSVFADKMILMFQKEVADRILSEHNSKKYGRISILGSAFYSIKKITDVNKNDFFPVPKVDSSVLCFDKLKKNRIEFNDIKYLEKITYHLFSNRRKKIKKKLQNIFP